MIVVTGASRGLGKAIVDRLINKGNRVIQLSRSYEGDNADIMECDVSDYFSVKSVAKKLKKMDEPLEVVINAAGIASMNMAVTTDNLTVQKLIQTNLIGTINCSQLFAPIMIRPKKGLFINFSTIAVPLAIEGESIYAASKAGVETFSRVFAREMAHFNIRVNCIAPGPIRTDLIRGISNNQIEKITSQQIITKQFQKEDVCDIVELIMDKRSNSLSGQVFNIGGI